MGVSGRDSDLHVHAAARDAALRVATLANLDFMFPELREIAVLRAERPDIVSEAAVCRHHDLLRQRHNLVGDDARDKLRWRRRGKGHRAGADLILVVQIPVADVIEIHMAHPRAAVLADARDSFVPPRAPCCRPPRFAGRSWRLASSSVRRRLLLDAEEGIEAAAECRRRLRGLAGVGAAFIDRLLVLMHFLLGHNIVEGGHILDVLVQIDLPDDGVHDLHGALLARDVYLVRTKHRNSRKLILPVKHPYLAAEIAAQLAHDDVLDVEIWEVELNFSVEAREHHRPPAVSEGLDAVALEGRYGLGAPGVYPTAVRTLDADAERGEKREDVEYRGYVSIAIDLTVIVVRVVDD